MNLKSYSRGIGAGLIVAALVLGIGGRNYKMSDADVKKRAAELGMTESSTLINNVTKAENDVSGNIIEQANNSDVPDEAPPLKEPDKVTVPPIIETDTTVSESGGGEDDLDISNPGDDVKQDNPEGITDNPDGSDEDPDDIEKEPDEEIAPPTINPLPEDEPGYITDGDVVEIVVIRGDSSVSVARRMYEAGLVESAVEFDKYLCSNGYDKRICVGTYKIAIGADFDEMARIITRR